MNIHTVAAGIYTGLIAYVDQTLSQGALKFAQLSEYEDKIAQQFADELKQEEGGEHTAGEKSSPEKTEKESAAQRFMEELQLKLIEADLGEDVINSIPVPGQYEESPSPSEAS
jgi:signal recognition particle GTPase